MCGVFSGPENSWPIGVAPEFCGPHNGFMPTDTKPAAETPAERAVAAGYWVTKDHGRWHVGKGHGAAVVILSRDHRTKAAARTAMVKAHREESADPSDSYESIGGGAGRAATHCRALTGRIVVSTPCWGPVAFYEVRGAAEARCCGHAGAVYRPEP